MPSAAARPSSRFRSILVFLILAAILLAFIPLGRLSIHQPSSVVPRLSVQFSAPGLTASLMETVLTRPLENSLADMPGLAALYSVTTRGNLRVDLHPMHRRDIDRLQREVQSRLERARISWPASMDPPAISLMDASAEVAQFKVASRAHDPLALRDWVETEFARQLRELPGVESVEVKGGAVREILVMPDQRRLAGLGLSFDDLLQAIRKYPEMPAVMQMTAPKKRSRREPLQSGNVTAVSAIPVSLPDGESVSLGEIASLTHVENPEPSGDAPGIHVTVNKQASADSADVARRVDAHVDWMRANRLIPDGMELDFLAGRVEFARESFKDLTRALMLGLTLVLLTSLLLHGARRTLILGVILVASLQVVLIAMALTGAGIDSVTFAGLVLGTGFFSGAALLLFAYAPGPDGINLPRAVISAASVAMMAVLAAIILAGGELAQRYREWAIAMGGTWLLSTLLALWLVPIFDAPRKEMKKVPWIPAIHRAMGRARQYYERWLGRALQRARLTAVLFAAMAAAFAAVWLTQDFSLPTGQSPSRDIRLRLQGPDNVGSAALATEIVHRLSTLPELRRINHSAQGWREEFELHLQEDRARDLGVDIAMAGRALAIAETGITVGSFRDADHRYKVLMRLPPAEADAATMGKILLLGELERRPAVYLRDVAVIERVTVPLETRRHDGKPVIDIVTSLAQGVSSVQALKRIDATMADMDLPPDYRLSFGHEYVSRGIGFKAAGIAVLLLFLSQALLNRSLRLALQIVLVAGIVPLGVGAVLILLAVPFTTATWLGLIILLGITAGHSALLFIPAEVQPQPVSLQRLRRAARHQFRPLLAMVLTGILGIAGLVWINSDMYIQHILITLIAGLLLSLPVNLFMTPLLHRLFSRKEQISIT